MATMPVANGNGDLDLEIRAHSPSTKRGCDDVTRRGLVTNGGDDVMFNEELLGNIQIYTIWMRRFSEDREEASEAWYNFRKEAIQQYENFNGVLKNIEDELYITQQEEGGGGMCLLDLSWMVEKQGWIDTIGVKVRGVEDDFAQVSKVLEEFCSYLPNEKHRHKLVNMTTSIRRRYFNLLQHLNTANHILQWLVPRLQNFESAGNDVKTWLESVQGRIEEFVPDSKGSMLHAEEAIEELLDELIEKKDVYEDFISNGKSVENIHADLKRVFRSDVSELVREMREVTNRWDATCEALENLLSEVTKERKEIELMKKTDVEKVDIKLEEEIQLCTCETPFKINKVGDGKYTFGTSKTVRLVRIHGQSIVVRVGGGWEYVYNFLMKVDPCRAKAFAPGTRKMSTPVNGIQCNTGLTLTPLDNKDSAFTMSVQRFKKTSITPGRTSGEEVTGRGGSGGGVRLRRLDRTMSIDDISLRKNRGVLRSSVSVDDLDGCGGLEDIGDEGEGEVGEGEGTALPPAVRALRSRSKTTDERPRRNSVVRNGRQTPTSGTPTSGKQRNNLNSSKSSSTINSGDKDGTPKSTKALSTNGKCNSGVKNGATKNGPCEPHLCGNASTPTCKNGTCAGGLKNGDCTPDLKNGTTGSITNGTFNRDLKNGKSPPNPVKNGSPPNLRNGSPPSVKNGSPKLKIKNGSQAIDSCDGTCTENTSKNEKLKKPNKRDSIINRRQKSSDNIVVSREKSSDDVVERRPKSSAGRRVSLMDRQSTWAQKRSSTINGPSTLDG